MYMNFQIKILLSSVIIAIPNLHSIFIDIVFWHIEIHTIIILSSNF